MPKAFQAALVQMRVEPGHPENNLQRAGALAHEAAAHGAQLLIFPEALDLGWTDPSAPTLAQSIPDGSAFTALRAIARHEKVYLCAGVTEKATTHGSTSIYNAAVLISPSGECLLHHRKINELAIAHHAYETGDRLGVVQTPLGRIGMIICADAFADGQTLLRALGYMQADLILVPSAWVVPATHDQEREPYGQLWLDQFQPVARDFALWILATSNVGPVTSGPWAGRNAVGCSMAIDPTGQATVRAPYGVSAEGIYYVQVTPNPRPARGTDWSKRWGRGIA